MLERVHTYLIRGCGGTKKFNSFNHLNEVPKHLDWIHILSKRSPLYFINFSSSNKLMDSYKLVDDNNETV